jgi:hypothetical protein
LLTCGTGLERCDCRPFSCPLLAGLVQYPVEDRLTIFIFVFENVGSDLDQEGIEDAFVPFLKNLSDLVLRDTQTTLKNVICFRDQLHVTILDPYSKL